MPANRASCPPEITPEIQRLRDAVVPGAELLYLDITPLPGCQPNFCHVNVARQIVGITKGLFGSDRFGGARLHIATTANVRQERAAGGGPPSPFVYPPPLLSPHGAEHASYKRRVSTTERAACDPSDGQGRDGRSRRVRAVGRIFVRTLAG
jgi:hypothetical protein